MPNTISVGSVLLLWFSLQAYAAPTDPPPPPGGLKIPLQLRSPTNGRSLSELGRLAKSQRDTAIAKYSLQENRLDKRSTGYNLYVLFPWSFLT